MPLAPDIIEIHDINARELDPYCRLTEAQLRNRLEPQLGVFIAESPKVIRLAWTADTARCPYSPKEST